MNEAVTHVESATMPPAASLEPVRPMSEDATPETLPFTVIEPARGWGLSGLGELWRFRELLLFLAWRDIKIRYKQTVLGIGWAVAQPVATMIVFTLFLGRVSGVATGVEHYPLFVFTGMIGWTFFINTVTTAGNSVIANERLITKVYFPRLIIPLSTVGVSIFDLVIGSVLLAGMMIVFGVAPGWSILLLPMVVLALGVASAGFGILFAALIVAQRDFKYILAFASQLWLFATPCIYLSVDVLGETTRTWLPLNPAYGLVLAFRHAILGGPFDWYSFGVSAVVGVVVFLVGAIHFRRVERSFADLI
ncbi:MAG TPA: ABC transporter permease [Gemmata sp.]|nr:ABC transporter permease [Gemmata sp.]